MKAISMSAMRPWLWAAACAFALALAAANLWLGDLNQDEGWYLYAARQLSEGKLPYRDFAFPQGPVQPLLYSAINPIITKTGLLGGRTFTALLGLLTALLAAGVASRLAPPSVRQSAALITFMLVAINEYQSYYFAVVKTYSATALFLTGSAYALIGAAERKSAFAAFTAGALCMLAAGARASAALALPIMALWLFLEWRRNGFRGWLFFCAGAVIAGAVTLLPFALLAWDNFFFFVVKYHTLRKPGPLLSMLVYKAGFVARLLQAYPAAMLLGAAACVARFTGMAAQPAAQAEPSSRLAPALWAVVAAITLAHFGAPFPYDDYQVPLYPIFAACVAVAAMSLIANKAEAAVSWLVVTVFAACLLGAAASPMNQDWFLQERDRIWWRIKDQAPIAKLRETAARIRSMAKPGAVLLTQDPYLAVETGMHLPRGLEMGQFSYFPALDSESARRLHVLNRELFMELLQTCNAPVAAMSGYAFAMESPDITPVPPLDEAAFRSVLDQRYERIATVPHFGQALTELNIYQLRTTEKTP